MEQNRNRGQDMPNRSSDMEPAEGSRDTVRDRESTGESGRGMTGERNRERDSDRESGGGITNRDLERERAGQAELPERGRSKSERDNG